MEQIGVSVMLNTDQTNQLKTHVFEVTKEAIDQARIDSGLERPFLREKKWQNF